MDDQSHIHHTQTTSSQVEAPSQTRPNPYVEAGHEVHSLVGVPDGVVEKTDHPDDNWRGKIDHEEKVVYLRNEAGEVTGFEKVPVTQDETPQVDAPPATPELEEPRG